MVPKRCSRYSRMCNGMPSDTSTLSFLLAALLIVLLDREWRCVPVLACSCTCVVLYSVASPVHTTDDERAACDDARLVILFIASQTSILALHGTLWWAQQVQAGEGARVGSFSRSSVLPGMPC